MENFEFTYNVDMVFCIDCTGSMGKLLDTVKENALNFYSDVVNSLENGKKKKKINSLRIRIVAFRDYLADHNKAMLVTDFFHLPEQNEEFEKCVRGLQPSGGGDEPEDGLEALAYAIKSKWNTEGVRNRQIIVVWTDASTHELGFGKADPNYPNGMAKDFDTLTEWWGDAQNSGFMNQSAKRLLLFAPDAKYWSTISDNWDNVLHFPSEAGNGLKGLEYREILDAIANSI